MNLLINDKLLEKYNLSFSELIYLLSKEYTISSEEENHLTKEGYLYFDNITKEGTESISDIINDSAEEPSSDTRLLKLAENMMAIFPKGKKPGSPYYWKCNKKEVQSKLKRFFAYYGNKYSDNEILQATKQYVESFNGDYTYMRILKYFIMKADIKEINDGGRRTTEKISDLATCLENLNDYEDFNSEWTATLR